MAKMKILQPEMIRLKELHKGDKAKLQQEMMALYKREKVNPYFGLSTSTNSNSIFLCNL